MKGKEHILKSFTGRQMELDRLLAVYIGFNQ